MNDRRFTLSTRIARPAAEVFAWHERPGALARLCPPWERVEVVAASGGVRDGARVTVRNKVGPIWTEWQVEHRDYVAGKQFRDVQLSGPFAKWEHLHLVMPDGPDACTLTDTIEYRLPAGGVGQAFGGGFARRQLERLFAWRHATTRADLELPAPLAGEAPRRVVIAGASGMIGQALGAFLRTRGHTVVRLVRRASRGTDELVWDPAKGTIDLAALEGVDAVVNLAGENVGAGRWTVARRDAIRRSRDDTTRTLVQAIGALRRKPEVLVNASAVGFYGNRGDAVLTEAEPAGAGFLAEVCQAWEAQAGAVNASGVRSVFLRFGVVLSPAGGALAKLLPLFRAGLGGRVGTGEQWMSWIGIDDAVGALHHALVAPACHGPLNATAPEPVTNAAFTATLGRVLSRPAVLPVPAFVLKAVFGEMADATLLASQRAVPAGLVAAGYAFRHPTLESTLRHVLGRR